MQKKLLKMKKFCFQLSQRFFSPHITLLDVSTFSPILSWQNRRNKMKSFLDPILMLISEIVASDVQIRVLCLCHKSALDQCTMQSFLLICNMKLQFLILAECQVWLFPFPPPLPSPPPPPLLF